MIFGRFVHVVCFHKSLKNAENVPLGFSMASFLSSIVSVQTAFTSEFMAEVASSERKDVKLEGSVVSAQEQSSPVTMLNAFLHNQTHGKIKITSTSNNQTAI